MTESIKSIEPIQSFTKYENVRLKDRTHIIFKEVIPEDEVFLLSAKNLQNNINLETILEDLRRYTEYVDPEELNGVFYVQNSPDNLGWLITMKGYDHFRCLLRETATNWAMTLGIFEKPLYELPKEIAISPMFLNYQHELREAIKWLFEVKERFEEYHPIKENREKVFTGKDMMRQYSFHRDTNYSWDRFDTVVDKFRKDEALIKQTLFQQLEDLLAYVFEFEEKVIDYR